jgi:predicted alpha/beta superfamily hydrolase
VLDYLSVFITPFNTKRTIRVHLPEDYYNNEKRYPVLYMHDGKNVFRDEDAVGGVSLDLETYLENIGAELIVVGIDANSSHEGSPKR